MNPLSVRGRTVSWLLVCLTLGCGSTDPDDSGFTMAALVNGASWSPGGDGTTPPTATLYTGDNTLVLNGTQSGVSPKTQGISIAARNVVGPGTYVLADTGSAGGSALYSKSDGSIFNGDWTMTFYWTSSTQTGSLVVTELDLAGRTISGTFNFKAANPLSGVVSVTSGTFSGRLATTSGSASH